MCSILITQSPKFIKEDNFYVRLRGPDYTNTIEFDGLYITHNLLSVRNKELQPCLFENDRYAILFNGEIYNTPPDLSEIEFIYDVFKNNNITEISEYLDGEYAIAIIDRELKLLYLLVDPFASKPLYYSDKNVIACSLMKPMTGNIKKVLPSTAVVLNYRTNQITTYTYDIFMDKINQNSISFDKWCELFESSVKKRSNAFTRKLFLGLSSGYDSGAIVCALNNLNISYTSYTIKASEDKSILEYRYKLIKSHQVLKFTQDDYDYHRKLVESLADNTLSGYSPKNDKASYGLSHICETAAKNDEVIYLSGQGSDEIISDYGDRGKKIFQASQFGGYFPKDIKTIFPYKNFYTGSQQDYISKEEVVAGIHGVETRYPFLDKALVLEFLNLQQNLKNKYYKSPIHYYLQANQFPFKIGDKRGFSAHKGLDA